MVHVDVRRGRVFALVEVSGARKVGREGKKRIVDLPFCFCVEELDGVSKLMR